MQVLLKSSGADIQDRALYRNRPITAVSLNKGVLHRYSLAKYAVAFLRNISGSRFLWPQVGRRPAKVF
jgi:hypothetical protein